MKIGLLKETKNPVDNRVALSPVQVAMLNKKYLDSIKSFLLNTLLPVILAFVIGAI